MSSMTMTLEEAKDLSKKIQKAIRSAEKDKESQQFYVPGAKCTIFINPNIKRWDKKR